MYGPEHVIPPVRSNAERMTDHPVYKAWQDHRVCKAFSRDEVRETVIPGYMGLIKQLDDQLGRLFKYLEDTGRMDDTMIVVSSDHGDYLGDHWLGEKDLFHDASARVPLIIYDPREEAESTRGTVCDELVEGIDLAPTFVELMGGEAKPHIMEGRSLVPLLEGKTVKWRKYAISEYDYSTRQSRLALKIDQADARLLMIFDGRWKYIHAEGFRPLLFDLESDPDELVDLGADPEYEETRARLHEALFSWSRKHHSRITRTPAQVDKMAAGGEPPGILIGYWDEDEIRESGRKSAHPPVS
jgi:arylsulfatase A-like enzyme